MKIYVLDSTFDRLQKRFKSNTDICKFVDRAINKILDKVEQKEKEDQDKTEGKKHENTASQDTQVI